MTKDTNAKETIEDKTSAKVDMFLNRLRFKLGLIVLAYFIFFKALMDNAKPIIGIKNNRRDSFVNNLVSGNLVSFVFGLKESFNLNLPMSSIAFTFMI